MVEVNPHATLDYETNKNDDKRIISEIAIEIQQIVPKGRMKIKNCPTHFKDLQSSDS